MELSLDPAVLLQQAATSRHNRGGASAGAGGSGAGGHPLVLNSVAGNIAISTHLANLGWKHKLSK